jgi:hypothetical protein
MARSSPKDLYGTVTETENHGRMIERIMLEWSQDWRDIRSPQTEYDQERKRLLDECRKEKMEKIGMEMTREGYLDSLAKVESCWKQIDKLGNDYYSTKSERLQHYLHRMTTHLRQFKETASTLNQTPLADISALSVNLQLPNPETQGAVHRTPESISSTIPTTDVNNPPREPRAASIIVSDPDAEDSDESDASSEASREQASPGSSSLIQSANTGTMETARPYVNTASARKS